MTVAGASSSSSVKPEPPSRHLSKRQQQHHVLPALLSGSLQAVLFNPVDRALYLRVNHRRRFLDWENWSHPFQGFANAALYRTVASGMYLFWQAEASEQLTVVSPAMPPSLHQFSVGTVAGAMNGILLNPMQLVKFRMWTNGTDARFFSTFAAMYQAAGWRAFQRGSLISVARDVTFGIAYELLRGMHTDGESMGLRLAKDCVAGMIASTVSSPLNYARNQIYGSPTLGCPLNTRTLCHYLWLETMALGTTWERVAHVNARLNVGWGTVRVGVGMAVGQLLFRWCQEALA